MPGPRRIRDDIERHAGKRGGCSGGRSKEHGRELIVTALPARSGGPAVPIESDATASKSHAFYLQAQALLPSELPGQGDVTPRAHDALPRNSTRLLQCPDRQPRRTGESGGRSDLAVGDYFPPRYRRDHGSKKGKLGRPRRLREGDPLRPEDSRGTGSFVASSGAARRSRPPSSRRRFRHDRGNGVRSTFVESHLRASRIAGSG